MIISRARRFIFVHIPKTGGTALTLAYEQRAAKDDILIADTPKARQRAGRWRRVRTAGRVWKHSTLSDVLGLITPEEVEDFQVVTLVRNPWDRVVSYYHWLKVQGFAHPAVGLARALSFSGFVNHPQTMASLRLWPYGAYLRRADGSEKPALMIRLEHYATDAVPMEAHLGLRLPLPRLNESARAADWRPYYSDADARLVGELCGEDVARFGYRFDPGPAA